MSALKLYKDVDSMLKEIFDSESGGVRSVEFEDVSTAGASGIASDPTLAKIHFNQGDDGSQKTKHVFIKMCKEGTGPWMYNTIGKNK